MASDIEIRQWEAAAAREQHPQATAQAPAFATITITVPGDLAASVGSDPRTLAWRIHRLVLDEFEPGASRHCQRQTPTGYRHDRLGITTEVTP